RHHKAQRDTSHRATPDPVVVLRTRVEAATIVALRRYTPHHFAGRVGLFLPNREWLRPGNAMLRWRRVARDTEEYCGPEGCEGDQKARLHGSRQVIDHAQHPRSLIVSKEDAARAGNGYDLGRGALQETSPQWIGAKRPDG